MSEENIDDNFWDLEKKYFDKISDGLSSVHKVPEIPKSLPESKEEETHYIKYVKLKVSQEYHNKLVYDVLRKHGPCTRPFMSSLLHIPRSTIYDALKRLEIKGMISKERKRITSKFGRPNTVFSIIE